MLFYVQYKDYELGWGCDVYHVGFPTEEEAKTVYESDRAKADTKKAYEFYTIVEYIGGRETAPRDYKT